MYAEAKRQYYLRNREKQIADNKWKPDFVRQEIVGKIKENTPCGDCRKYFPWYVMQVRSCSRKQS